VGSAPAIVTGYKPRKWQRYTHNKLKRFNVLVFHRRGGKTVFSINEMVDQSMRFNKVDPDTGDIYRNPQYAYVAPTFRQVEKIAWPYFKEYMAHIPGVKFNESKLRITYPHKHGTCTIYLMGADNFDTERGAYYDGYILDEFADMHPDVRDKVLLPTLSDRQGWEIIIGTPKGDNAFKRIYEVALEDPENYFCCLHKASETGILPASELAMLKKTMSPEAFAQEYECDFNAAPAGYYYAEVMQEAFEDQRITKVPYDKINGVGTFWDLGVNDLCTIWFVQEIGRELRIIDYEQGNGKGLDYWWKEVVDKKEYDYVGHWLPHDIATREITTGRARIDYLEEMGMEDIHIVPKAASVSEDIHLVRQLIPLCVFDKINCALGIKCLKEYQRKWDSKNKVFMNTPLHNEASHGADGFRQLAKVYEQGLLNHKGRQRSRSLRLLEDAQSEHDILGQ